VNAAPDAPCHVDATVGCFEPPMRPTGMCRRGLRWRKVCDANLATKGASESKARAGVA
jgi:hypothetical protein